MDSRDIIGLYEAYLDVYEDQLDEGFVDTLAPRVKSDGSEMASPGLNAFRKSWELEQKEPGSKRQKRQTRRAGHLEKVAASGIRLALGQQQNEELDIYDVVLDHLLDEGYCDDVESAEIIMANMSEEWLDGILDEAKVDAGKSDEQKVVARRIRQGSTSSWDRDDSNRQANHRFRRNVTKGSSDYADPHGTYDRRPNTYKKEQEYVKKLSPEDREKRMEQNRRSIRRGR